MNNTMPPQIKYEPEADVLTLESSDEPIDYAKEIGNVVVHFSRNNTPVLVEILEASKFLHKSEALIRKTAVPRPERAVAF